MAEFPFDLVTFINFSHWAAWLHGINGEALQQNTFDSAVLCYPPSFPQTLAERTLEIWLSQSCSLSSGKRRHICVAITSQSPNLASLGATPPLRVKRHEPQARHRALGNPAAATALSEVEVNPGVTLKRLQLQLWAWYRHIPSSLLGCCMRWRQL